MDDPNGAFKGVEFHRNETTHVSEISKDDQGIQGNECETKGKVTRNRNKGNMILIGDQGIQIGTQKVKLHLPKCWTWHRDLEEHRRVKGRWVVLASSMFLIAV